MSKYKTYMLNKLVSQFSLRLNNRFATFKTIGFASPYSSGKPQYSTKDEEEQASIESSNAFKDGLIKLVSEVDIEPKKKTKAPVEPPKAPDEDGLDNLDGLDVHEPAVYEDITKFRDAQGILTSPPYNVPKTSTELKSKETIHAKAAELGISFPNLV